MEFENQTEPVSAAPQRSTFVTVLAWIFIVFGGFATFISILQNIMIHMMLPKGDTGQAMQQVENIDHMPAFANFIFNHFDLFFLFFLIVSATSFIAAIALLKRKNWARIVFIVLMSLGILWNLGGLVMQFTMFSSMPEMANQTALPGFEKVMLIMKVASTIMVLAISTLFAWIIKKLSSSTIKAEFV
ncbi:MAG: hypothetical protein AB7D06_17795 [Pedobacter sp.]